MIAHQFLETNPKVNLSDTLEWLLDSHPASADKSVCVWYLFWNLYVSRSGFWDTWNMLLCILQHLYVECFEKIHTWYKSEAVCKFQGPKALCVCVAAAAGAFRSRKTRPLCFWNMYLMDVVTLHRFVGFFPQPPSAVVYVPPAGAFSSSQNTPMDFRSSV